jgi:hypothetical protein
VEDAPSAARDSPKRRRFTADYKAGILTALERLDGRGAASALLRKEGLYWSHVAKWRRQRDVGELEDSWTEPWVRSRIQTLIDERAELMREIEALEERNRHLRERLGLSETSRLRHEAGGRNSA